MSKLYEITNDFYQLMLKAEDEELTQEEYDKLGKELALELKNKSKNIIGIFQNEKTDIEAIGSEIERLTELKKAKENRLERFKEYVKNNMERLNLDKIETELGILSLVKNPISVEIVKEDEIPGEYKKVVQTVKVDKKAISDNFKTTGELVPGVRIISDKRSLRIK